MNRRDVLSWLSEHPEAAHADPESIVKRCERAVRRHATEDAWLAAKAYVMGRAHAWEKEWSPPASEDFVAREICHQLAYELRTHEPRVEPGAEEHLAGGPVREDLEPEGWELLRQWVRDLAAEEEHRVWREIVHYTDKRARNLIRDHHMSRDWEWDAEHRYTAIAAHVAEILARDYSIHAHAR